MLVKRVLGPLGAWWLRDRVEGRIPVRQGLRIRQARQNGSKVQLTLESAAGSATEVEVATSWPAPATGSTSATQLSRPDLRERIRTLGGFPCLSPSFESSVPGLFFAGLTAAAEFGPVMRFVCGTPYAGGPAPP